MPNTKIEVLLPHGEATSAGGAVRRLAPRLGSLAGATVGVVWNGWHCMNVIQARLREALVSDFGAKAVLAVQTGTTIPMTPAQLADATARWDAAIVGLGT
jgi:hypothetical protein